MTGVELKEIAKIAKEVYASEPNLNYESRSTNIR